MPDENRVFDVSRPSRVSPPPTSRPVIVGRPLGDPMVRDDKTAATPASATKIKVTDTAGNDGEITIEQAMAAHQSAEADAQGSPAIYSDDSNAAQTPPAELSSPPDSVGEGPFTEVGPTEPVSRPSELPPPAEPQPLHIEGLHVGEPRPKNNSWKWIAASVLILLVAAYAAIDSGLINAGVKMPFHIFKQKSQSAAPPAASNTNPKPAGPVLPAGFKQYQLADTNVAFAAPAAWGDPTSVTDPGYTQRGGTNKPDGTYAYLVNFTVNKDVQIAVTSSKYLPAARTPLYYDYLQWCVGSSDNKIYQSVLNYSTTNKVDTPTTITCNQGPLAGASQLDNNTIVQLKAADAAGKTIGDVYAMNLKDPSLVVFRVKDAAMTNGSDIKQMLDTVQLASTSTTSTPAPSQ